LLHLSATTTRGGNAQMQYKAGSGDPPRVILGPADNE